jgi:tungstate transport system substrate-binding protein
MAGDIHSVALDLHIRLQRHDKFLPVPGLSLIHPPYTGRLTAMKRARHTLSLIWLCLCSLNVQADSPVLRMATTTSTENSGLLDVILPKFETLSGLDVQVLAVGTGQALRLGCNGDVDVVLVHAPAAEQKFVDDGCGVNRRQVMYNDFVIVGPPADPAGVAHSRNSADALARIAKSRSTFVSRGDDSGTNKKELTLWQKAGVKPEGRWYREAGQGMGKVLQMSGELDGYTLTDRGTWLAYRAKSPLKLLYEKDPALYNPYAVIAVNPERYPDSNYIGAMTFIGWITSPQGQQSIADYRIEGQTLFTPLAVTHPGKH